MNISVAGVAEKEGKVLVALRKPGTSIGEKWEFPGGKLEDGETPEDALIREYDEELNVEIKVFDWLCEGGFSNGKKNYLLKAYRIELETEDFKITEHQQICWVDIAELSSMNFPDSDQIVINYLLSR
ncbi:MAG: (deoxy)nucleoside triphosphate pyrophosphohydrolase [Spirochaetales bacterium]|uniref:8-oxo-dGTP diphosphatase n=1 Tax=Candidatus Thalassospirochaeta sargassi TaxID=3119039 RepID=A0AAJ1IIM0_9SPIO|nr:(deoxy)nucleoside triphosphate pyrophosphohydrolase [Spirochaetales bacterium]